MTYDMKGVLVNTGCEKSLLIFLTILLLSTIQQGFAVEYPCVTSGTNLICDNLGNISQVPAFRPTLATYDLVKVINTPALTTVQANAFNGMKVKRIQLDNLGVTTVESGSFSGLRANLIQISIIVTPLASIPDDVFNPVSDTLVSLSLHRNQLATLPSALFSSLIHLTSLTLGDNGLVTLPDDIFSNLSQLTSLNLQSNKLNTLSSAVLRNQNRLTTLFLVSNELESISDDAFSNLTQLQGLYLHDNKLKTLTSALFSKTLSLAWLTLDNNELETISDNAFSNTPQLQVFYVNNNNLTTLSSNLFINSTNPSNLRIENNPFICDCRLTWLRNSTLHTLDVIRETPVCVNPPSLNGQLITSFPLPNCDTTPVTTSITTTPITPTVTTPGAAAATVNSLILGFAIVLSLCAVFALVLVTISCLYKKNAMGPV